MSADITEERIAELRDLASDMNNGWAQEMNELLDALLSARSQLATLQSVPQGVEVPALPFEEYQRRVGSPELLTAWFRQNARLVPTPPQAAPGAVDVVLDPPKSDRDCGDCTRLAICNGELACLCGPTGKMFARKEPDHPLQPEERRVGPDRAEAVVVPKEEWERLKRNHLRRMIDSCPEAETRAWQTFRASDRNLRLGAATPRAEQITKRLGRFVAKCDDALRTSAQDHNGEGAK